MAPTTTVETRTVKTAPPSRPSQVLLGLIDGARGVRPIHPPTTRAPTSLATVAMIAPNKKAMPWRSGKADGERRRPAYEPSSETHPTANSVAAVPATGDPRSIPNRYQTRVNTVINTRISGRAATPLL